MKRIFITLLFLLPLAVMAQLTFELNGVANRRISSELPEGAKIKLTKIRAGGPGVSSSAILNIGDK